MNTHKPKVKEWVPPPPPLRRLSKPLSSFNWYRPNTTHEGYSTFLVTDDKDFPHTVFYIYYDAPEYSFNQSYYLCSSDTQEKHEAGITLNIDWQETNFNVKKLLKHIEYLENSKEIVDYKQFEKIT